MSIDQAFLPTTLPGVRVQYMRHTFCLARLFTDRVDILSPPKNPGLPKRPGCTSYPASPDRRYVDLVVHEIAFVNTTTQPVRLNRLRVEAMAHNVALASADIPIADIISTTQDQVEMRQQGLAALADMSIPASTLVAATTSWPLARRQPMGRCWRRGSISPCTARRPSCASRRRSAMRPVAPVRSSPPCQLRRPPTATPTRCRSTARGSARSIPGITRHHRWNAQTEFAFDFWKLDTLGSPSRGAGESPTDYYAYGQPVFAAADGKVAAIEEYRHPGLRHATPAAE